MDQASEATASDKRKRRKTRKRHKKSSSDPAKDETQAVEKTSLAEGESSLPVKTAPPPKNCIHAVESSSELLPIAECPSNKLNLSTEENKRDLVVHAQCKEMASVGSGKKEKPPQGPKKGPNTSADAPLTIQPQGSEEGLTKPSTTDKTKKPEGLTKAERRAQYLQEMEQKKEGKSDSIEPAKSKGPPAVSGSSQEVLAGGEPSKSKAQIRAERRALQEAQRAAKGANQGPKSANQATKVPAKETKGSVTAAAPVTASAQKPVAFVSKDEPIKMSSTVARQQPLMQKKVQFFSHLQQYPPQSLSQHSPVLLSEMHPAILRLGLQYADGVVCGSNARCVAMLHALKQVIKDYTTPPNKELSRDLDEKIKPYIDFLQECRPLSVSVENAVKHLKRHISQIPSQYSDEKAKLELIEEIDRYIEEHIIFAGKGIAANALAKINDGDVVLIFSHSSVINNVLVTAHNENKDFKVVVVDSRPKLEGHKALVALVKHGLNCSYVMMNALSYTMQKVTKVLLGAHALLANGYVLSRVGSSQVALVAKSYNVPVLVCCETHKFCERVQTDSFVSNELGNPDDLASDCLATWRDVPSLTLLNLVYDLTPPDLISAVVTEIGGLLPCTSVPVILRLKQHRS